VLRGTRRREGASAPLARPASPLQTRGGRRARRRAAQRGAPPRRAARTPRRRGAAPRGRPEAQPPSICSRPALETHPSSGSSWAPPPCTAPPGARRARGARRRRPAGRAVGGGQRCVGQLDAPGTAQAHNGRAGGPLGAGRGPPPTMARRKSRPEPPFPTPARSGGIPASPDRHARAHIALGGEGLGANSLHRAWRSRRVRERVE
jgi:hypothetical protein